MWEQILDFFQSGKMQFVFELLISYLVVVWLFKPRKWWWIIMPASIVGLGALAYFTFKNEIWWYLLIAVLTAGIFKACFKVNIWECVFSVTCAYATQHLFFKVKRVYSTVCILNEYYPEWLQYLLYWVMLVLVLVTVGFLFIRRLKKERAFKVNNIKMLFVSVVLLFLAIFINWKTDGLWRWYRWSELHAWNCVVGIICCGLILENLLNNVYNKQKEEELRLIHSLWKMDRRQYEMSKQNIDTLNIKYHDLKYQINTILADDLGEKRKALKDAIKSLNTYDSMLKTGNETLDVLLTEKRLRCDELDIPIACIIDGEALENMEPVDIYSLFGNALDNALECLEKVEEKEKRFINVTVKRVKSFVRVEIENYIPQTDMEITKTIKTSKLDEAYHGFGLKSISHITKKYKGEMSVSIKDNVFKLEILMMP